MQRAADAVARQIGDQRIAVLFRESADGIADIGKRPAGLHLLKTRPHGAFAIAAEALDFLLHRRHGKRRTGIAEETVLHGRDIDIDEVTRLDDTRSRNAVGHFLVNADAGCPGELVAELRRRLRAIILQHLAADSIQLGRGDAGFQRVRHGLHGNGAKATDILEQNQFFFGGNDHVSVRRSVWRV
ncbi:hypothetical protein D3C86_1273150 [compost metagenome]